MRFIKICFTIIFSLSAILADEIDFNHDGWDRECYLYNRGILVKTLVRDVQPSGQKTVKWDGTNDLGQKVSAGLYFYRIEAEGFSDTKKMVLLK